MKRLNIVSTLKGNLIEDFINLFKMEAGKDQKFFDFWVVRHGETQANLHHHEWREQNNSLDRSIPLPKEIKCFRGNIDTGLTAKGEQQARDAGLQFKKSETKLKVLFTSPLRRALQTTKLILQSLGPDHSVERVIVLPIIRETVSSSDDIPSDIRELRKEFSSFDWTIINDFEKSQPENLAFWALDIGNSKECLILKKGLEQLKKENLLTFEERLKEMHGLLLQKISHVYPNIIEKGKDAFDRTEIFKNFLKEKFLIENKQYRNDEILVVSHAIFLLYLLATEKNINPKTYDIIDMPFPKNGEPMKYKLKL